MDSSAARARVKKWRAVVLRPRQDLLVHGIRIESTLCMGRVALSKRRSFSRWLVDIQTDRVVCGQGAGLASQSSISDSPENDAGSPSQWMRGVDVNGWSRNEAIESQAMSGAARAGGVSSALVLAIESKGGWTANRRFSNAVFSAIQGQLPFYRYFGAGRMATSHGIAAGVLERSATDWVRSSFNPLYSFLFGLDDPRAVVDCLNTYNSRDMGQAWELERDDVFAEYAEGEKTLRLADKPPCWALSSYPGEFRLRASRISPNGFDDPLACQIVSLASIQYAVDQARRRADGADIAPRTLSSIALDFGVERSAAAEAAWVFEREGGMSVESLVMRLGCGRRTLERELRAHGLSAGRLRLASMVVGASNQLRSAASLTQIAADQGFSDLAHMTRAFKNSCGMSPSALRGGRGGARSGRVSEP